MTFRKAIQALDQCFRNLVTANDGAFDIATTPASLLELLNVGGDRWRCVLMFEGAIPIAGSHGGGYSLRFSLTLQASGLLDRDSSTVALKEGGLMDRAQLLLERLRMAHFQTAEGNSHPEIDPRPADWLELKWLEADLPTGIRQLQLIGEIRCSTTTPSERHPLRLVDGA